MDLILFFIWIAVLFLAIFYLQYTIIIGVIGLVIGLPVYFIVEANKEEKRRQAQEAARNVAEKVAEEARIRGLKKKQDRYYKQMIVLGEKSIGLFESMPKYLESAEEYLDQAETDFSDGAFAPFWDSIEKAAKTLGRFDEGVQEINGNSSHYTELISKYEDTSPQFPLARKSVEKLSVGTGTAERMKSIVRTAQCNFQFATIYEQRKTNQILVAGFKNLAQALDRMTWQITASIDGLAGSVDTMASTLGHSMDAIHSRLGDIAKSDNQHHKELIKVASEGVVREKKALEMLDNIQHRRRPSVI